MKTVDLFKKGLSELTLPGSDAQIDAFMTYLSELKKWNRTYNLTALKNDEDIIVKHFLDSLLYLKAIPSGPLRLADAGAGAGFPGVPLKIVRPEIQLFLIESSRKKAAFLRHMIRLLDLNGTDVLEQRLEHLGAEYEKGFDVLVSRATFSIGEFLSLACPYLKNNGLLVMNKGPKVSGELKDMVKSSQTKNAVKEIIDVKLPFTDAHRNLIILGC